MKKEKLTKNLNYLRAVCVSYQPFPFKYRSSFRSQPRMMVVDRKRLLLPNYHQIEKEKKKEEKSQVKRNCKKKKEE